MASAAALLSVRPEAFRFFRALSGWGLNPLKSSMVQSSASIREMSDVDDREPPPLRSGKATLPCDLTDESWAQVEHLIPPAKRGALCVRQVAA
jgi:hypothetical protein